MTRSTFGIASTSPASCAHHSSRRSKNSELASDLTSLNGPVPTGQPLARSKLLNVLGSFPSQICWGTTTKRVDWPVARKSAAHLGPGFVKDTLTVKGSMTSAEATHSSIALENSRSGAAAFSMEKVKATSSASRRSEERREGKERVRTG